jgi:hypothetical protein
MMVAELGSTAAEAMLVFHKFEAGNGTYPLRLAPLPVLMLPQEGPADEFTVMLRLPVWESGVGVLESTTWIEKLVLPALVGVPLMTPAEERVNPAGNDVLFARLKVYGVTPPVAVNVAE